MKTHYFIATLALLLCTQGVSGQDSLPSRERSILFCKPDAEVKEILQAAKAEEPGHIKAPAFVLKTSDNKFIMTIGGEIKGHCQTSVDEFFRFSQKCVTGGT